MQTEHFFGSRAVDIDHILCVIILSAADQGVIRHASAPVRSRAAPDPEIVFAEFGISGGVCFRHFRENFIDNCGDCFLFRFDQFRPFHVDGTAQRIVVNFAGRGGGGGFAQFDFRVFFADLDRFVRQAFHCEFEAFPLFVCHAHDSSPFAEFFDVLTCRMSFREYIIQQRNENKMS